MNKNGRKLGILIHACNPSINGRLRQEDCEFEDNSNCKLRNYIVRLYLKTNKKQKRGNPKTESKQKQMNLTTFK
jgi:hypothetical protein